MWIYLAVVSAFFNSLTNIARRTHGSLAQPEELSWWTMVLGLPLGVGLQVIDRQPIHFAMGFIGPAIIAAVVGLYGGIHQMKAYKFSDASVVSPLSNLLPIALIISSFLILHTLPTWGGFVGILLIVGGVYYSSVSGKHGLMLPLKRILMDKGSRSMMIWVCCMAVSTTFMGVALRYASAAFVMVFVSVIQIAMLSVYLLCRPAKHRLKRGERVLRRWGWHVAAIAVFGTIAVFFQLQAMKLADTTYVLAVKRLDVLITVLLAGLFLKEQHILRRFKGSLIAIVGVVTVIITG